MLTQFLAATASLALLGSSLAFGGDARSADAIPAIPAALAAGQGASGGQCQVDVLRSAQPNTADVTREDLPDGSCRCKVIAGPESNNGSAESIVQSVIANRTCQSSAAAAAQQAAGSNGPGVVLPTVLGLVGLAALVTSIGNDTNG